MPPASWSAPTRGRDDAAEGCEVDVSVFGWEPLPGAGAAAVRVAEEGFLVVVPAAEAGQVVEFGDSGAAEGVAVVDLQVPADVAAGDDAGRVAHLERGAEVG